MKLLNTLLIRSQLIFDFLFRTFYGHSFLKYIRITPNVYLGGAFTQKRIQKIRDLGITAVVSMRIKPPVTGIKTLHLPTEDRLAPTLHDLERGVEFIKNEVREGGKVYVHCRQGVGRGPTMAIAYLMASNYELDEALNLIKKVRIFVNPTQKQLEVLKQFANKIKG